MRHPARRLADAMRSAAQREHERRGTGRYRGAVISTDPLRIDVMGLDLELDASDVRFGRSVITTALAVGDVLVLLEVDDDDWVVIQAEATDAEVISPPADPVQAWQPLNAYLQPGWKVNDTANTDQSQQARWYKDRGRIYLTGVLVWDEASKGANTYGNDCLDDLPAAMALAVGDVVDFLMETDKHESAAARVTLDCFVQTTTDEVTVWTFMQTGITSTLLTDGQAFSLAGISWRTET